MSGPDGKAVPAHAKQNQAVPDSAEGVARFHQELQQIARRELGRMARSGTIDTIALVNEAWLRVDGRDEGWNNRAHFLASMTTIMRHVLVDYARERGARRRGGDWLQVTASHLEKIRGNDSPVNVLALDHAMTELGQNSARLERVVELKVFGGMTIAEIADVMAISTATVSRELRVATAFLRQNLAQGT